MITLGRCDIGTGYQRQDIGNNIENNEIADATYLDQEYDAIQLAFNSSTGHDHGGSTGNGAPITVVGPAQDILVSSSIVRPKTNNVYDLGSNTFGFKNLYLTGTVIAPSLTGKFIANSGTNSAPSITFTGDEDTGISSPTANSLVFSTNGAARASLSPTGIFNVVNNVTIGGTLTVTGAITGASITGAINADSITSGTLLSARIVGTYSGLTGTGVLTTGSIGSGFGNINIGGNSITSGAIVSSGTITSSQNFLSSTGNVVLATNGGNVLLRPNGVSDSTGQLAVAATGNTSISGTLNVTGAITGPIGASNLTGTIASARLTGAYTGVTQLGTLTDLTVDNIFIDNTAIRSTANDNAVQIWGSSDSTGVVVRAFGKAHATNADTIMNDATRHLFRGIGGGNWFDLTSSGVALGNNLSISFTGTGAATTRTNLGIGSAASLDSGTSGGQVRTNTQNDARFLIASNNLTDVGNVSTARTNLGLGTMALNDAGTTSTQFRTNSQNDARFHISGTSTLAVGDLPTTTTASDWVRARLQIVTQGQGGTYAMLRYTGATTLDAGDTTAGTNLTYAHSSGFSGVNPPGTWRCMGYAPTNAVTLFIRSS